MELKTGWVRAQHQSESTKNGVPRAHGRNSVVAPNEASNGPRRDGLMSTRERNAAYRRYVELPRTSE